MIFTFAASQDIGNYLVEHLNLPFHLIVPHRYRDEEESIPVPEAMGDHVWVVQRLWPNFSENFIRLVQLVAVLKQRGCWVGVMVPYLPHGRQGEGASRGDMLWVRMLQTVGADWCATVDAHLGPAPGLFNISAQGWVEPLLQQDWPTSRPVLIAPDQGARERIAAWATAQGYEWVGLKKHRDAQGHVTMVSEVQECVVGRDCVIIDDIISSGETIVKAAETLKQQGARTVCAYVTHAVSQDFLTKTHDSPLKFLTITDSIQPVENYRGMESVRVATVSPAIAQAIQAILEDRHDNTISRFRSAHSG